MVVEVPPSSLAASGGSPGETREDVFAQLRTYCLKLLDLLRSPSPSRESPFLADMAEFLRRASPGLLQPCFDYTLLPLLLLLDTAVEGRSQQMNKTEGTPDSTLLKRHTISDNVAECALRCLEQLLRKCCLTSVDQMALVLKKLALGASLSPSDAEEEFREGIIKCVQAVFLLMEPCSLERCTCKQVVMTAHLSNSILQTHATATATCTSESKECLLAFLQSSSASAAVGHWLSLLLQAAEVEAERGLRGSAKLRIEAFLTVRILIAKVGSADALAFFLPGVVSRFTKALRVAKGMISGAAGSVGSIDQAIRGLTEFLVIVMRDESNVCYLGTPENHDRLCLDNNKSSESVLEALRQLPVNPHVSDESSAEPSIYPSLALHSLQVEKNTHPQLNKPLHVQRSAAWIEETSVCVDEILSAVFPHLCLHPAKKVRQGAVDSIGSLLLNCIRTLKRSKSMLLECLCVLVCDDSETVCQDAQDALESLFIVKDKYFMEAEIVEMLDRLILMLPRVVLGSEERLAVAHAQKVLVLMYYAGPDVVLNYILHSPSKSAQFLEILGSSLSPSSLYSGSFSKLILNKPLSIGYLHSVSELKAVTLLGDSNQHVTNDPALVVPKLSFIRDAYVKSTHGSQNNDFELPHMPPWFLNLGSEKLYIALAGVLRLLGLAMITGNNSDISLSLLIDGPLEYIQKLISEIRMKTYNEENWQSWYLRSGSSLLIRQASTAACVLNEIVYGTSGKSGDLHSRLLGSRGSMRMKPQENQLLHVNDKFDFDFKKRERFWEAHQNVKEQVIHCVGSVLHEYLSPEIWDLPVDQNLFETLQGSEAETLSLHVLQDVIMLHQVIIEGIGIFSICLGNSFVQSGFMHSSLYLLLQKLICSSNQIRRASDVVLHVLSAASGHSTVGHLVVSNADYIIDSLCRQLRRLDLNPDIPDVLAAMLSYVGAAHDILPLLEEPMRSVSAELEVLCRNQHPALTVPFLKAVREIARALKREASVANDQAASFYLHVKGIIGTCTSEKGKCSPSSVSHVGSIASEKRTDDCVHGEIRLEHWEELLVKLSEMKRYRCIVGSIAESCLKTAIPLLASTKELACLPALDIVEDGFMALAKVEEAFKHEKETKQEVERQIHLCSLHDLEDMVETSDEDVGENRLLPTMNKTWPYLLMCIKNRASVAVTRRCITVLSAAVQLCGGDFFIRRFRTDGSVIWKLLSVSPFRKMSLPSKQERQILLPYRSTSLHSEELMAETSSIKIQEAVLNMVAELSSNKRSASAVEAVLKKVSGLVVGIACSNVTNLREASFKALQGLACIDSDLIWLLLADVYYSLKHNADPSPPTTDLTEISLLLPPPSSAKEYLYIMYGQESSGFNLDRLAAETVYNRMFS